MYLDDLDSLNLRRYGIYEIAETLWIKQNLTKQDVCLDIGANIGYFTLLMAKCKQVYAFEPEPNNYNILQRNIELNELYNITLYNTAVSKDMGFTLLHICDTNRGMHRLYKSKLCSDVSISVPTSRIDDLHLKGITFIKMDVEGAELGALKVMKYLLTNNNIRMIMEFDPPSIIEYGAKPQEVYLFMKDLGYRMSLLPDIDRTVPYYELEQKALAQGYGINIYCEKYH